MRNKILTWMLIGFLGCTSMSNVVKAQSNEVSMNLSLRNKSVLQTGFIPSNNPVMQQSIKFKNEKFSFNIWSDYDLKNEQMREIDYGLSVPLINKPHLTIESYLGYFTFPGMNIPDAQEIGLNSRFSGLPLDINLYLGKLYGKNSGNGFAGKLQLSKDFDLTDKFNINLSARVGYNNNYFTNNKGLTHIVYSVIANYKLTNSLNVSLDMNVQKTINDFNGVFEDVFYGGLTLSRRF